VRRQYQLFAPVNENGRTLEVLLDSVFVHALGEYDDLLHPISIVSPENS